MILRIAILFLLYFKATAEIVPVANVLTALNDPLKENATVFSTQHPIIQGKSIFPEPISSSIQPSDLSNAPISETPTFFTAPQLGLPDPTTSPLMLQGPREHSPKNLTVSDAHPPPHQIPQITIVPEGDYFDSLLAPMPYRIQPARRNPCLWGNKMFVAIHSAAQNFGRRMAIRDTYASMELQKKLGFSVVFVLGLQDSELIQKWVETEAEQYDDILQAEFVEHYFNMTVKKLSWMRYAQARCPHTKWVLHLDDDAVMDVYSLLGFIENRKINDPSTIFCMAISYNQTNVVRNPYSKWYVSEEAYPQRFYPKYCAGAAYLLPQKALAAMEEAVKRMRYITIDDAFVTGILREAIGFGIRQLRPQGIIRKELDPLIYQFQTGNAVMAECPNEHCMRHLWEIIEMLHRTWNQPNVNITSIGIPEYVPVQVEIRIRWGETITYEGGPGMEQLESYNATREVSRIPRREEKRRVLSPRKRARDPSLFICVKKPSPE
ncbi:unnamed protein product, partial [Mesorhabditis spiculigera]